MGQSWDWRREVCCLMSSMEDAMVAMEVTMVWHPLQVHSVKITGDSDRTQRTWSVVFLVVDCYWKL